MRHSLLTWMLLASGCAFAQSPAREVSMCKQTTLRLKAASAGASRYEWYRNNELIIGSGAEELIVSEEGTYKAIGVNDDNCISQESIHIIIKHHTPKAVDDAAEGFVNNDIVLDVLKNDLTVCADFDGATLAIVEQPASGNAVQVDGMLKFSPLHNFVGQVTITYTIRDKTGQLSNIANVKIDILTNPLPVKLAYFDVSKQESLAKLEWGTAMESNSDHFDIERSLDLKDWLRIGTEKAAIESNVKRNYWHTDSLPESGTNYYRLKMVDADNSFTFSRVRSVHFPEFSWAEVYPNPVDDMLYVVIRNKQVKNIRLISNSGHVRLSRPVTSSSFTIPMKSYPIGMCYIHFEQDDGTVKIFKVMHQ
ncbi:Ig-like domain-containing protein [Dyadobacter pollutisoli]|uniref:Ig-like domain-containing protein n=1 Tax=Dyadobacter pollutisoli TaxID=2910158 RepID=A0A9E8NGE7_9BACT|nr:Ig-like domain-containing protein [Dyadobacter pollutisoli]WAC13599.1 Ig-like domain-containing protein [Dyadobacter pollutisoli]